MFELIMTKEQHVIYNV